MLTRHVLFFIEIVAWEAGQVVRRVQTLNEFHASYLRVYSLKEEGGSDAIAVGRR